MALREFFVTHPVDGNIVKVVQGITGFFDTVQDPAVAAAGNEENGNTERDLELAIGASMFGWQTPRALEISERPV